MAQPKPQYRLSVQASTEHLSKVRDFVASHAAEFGFDADDVDDIRLAVDEAYTNIIKHAYDYDDSQSVEINLGYNSSEFWISLFDDGRSFDPRSYSIPDIKRKIKEKKRGGVGVYLIRKLMDHVEYGRRGGRNVIRMVKKK